MNENSEYAFRASRNFFCDSEKLLSRILVVFRIKSKSELVHILKDSAKKWTCRKDSKARDSRTAHHGAKGKIFSTVFTYFSIYDRFTGSVR